MDSKTADPHLLVTTTVVAVDEVVTTIDVVVEEAATAVDVEATMTDVEVTVTAVAAGDMEEVEIDHPPDDLTIATKGQGTDTMPHPEGITIVIDPLLPGEGMMMMVVETAMGVVVDVILEMLLVIVEGNPGIPENRESTETGGKGIENQGVIGTGLSLLESSLKRKGKREIDWIDVFWLFFPLLQVS